MEPNIHYIDVREQQILITAYPIEIVNKLFDFGILLSGQVQQRSSQIDSKFSSYLGYSASVVALLSLGAALGGTVPLWLRLTILLSVVCALGAMFTAIWAMRSQMWPVPSEPDWFSRKEIGDPDQLRRKHVISMLLSHQIQTEMNVAKARLLPVVEIFLGFATTLTALVLAWRVI